MTVNIPAVVDKPWKDIWTADQAPLSKDERLAPGPSLSFPLSLSSSQHLPPSDAQENLLGEHM